MTENQRTVAAATALEDGKPDVVGELMRESHRSMRDYFQMVPVELDALVEATNAVAGCYGSHMIGGGFGGCTVSLVAKEAVQPVRMAAEALGAIVYLCNPSGGVDTVAAPE